MNEMDLKRDGHFRDRPTVYIETKAKPSQYPKTCMGVATYSFRKSDGHHTGYLYGFGRTDDTFRALILDRIIDKFGLPLNVHCRGLHNPISQAAASTTGLSARGKPYHNYEVLKRLGEAMTAGDLHVFLSHSEQNDMVNEQLEAFLSARELFLECEKHVKQYDKDLNLDAEYKIIKSSFDLPKADDV
tara:strand:- start:2575 stop:3135 length:561 start_codon:yes stop_codon:yes gene_type:complete